MSKVVADKTNKLKRQTFNMSHPTNATMAFGECVPISCQFLDKPSHSHFNVEHVTRMFPLIAPTFGNVKVITTHNFIGISEVFPKWKNVLGNKLSTMYNTSLANDGTNWIPMALKKFPTITPQSLFFLWGNSSGLVRRLPLITDPITGSVPDTLSYKISTQDRSHRVSYWMSHIFEGSSLYNDFVKPELDWTNFVIGSHLPFEVAEADFKITNISSGSSKTSWLGAFKATTAGNRVLKILEGLGYYMNPKGKKPMSLLPLLAWYRSYFINHMLPMSNYVDWETTACYKLIESFSHSASGTSAEHNYFDFNFDIAQTDHTPLTTVEKERITLLFRFFEEELANCVYVDDTLESACLNGNMTDRRCTKNPFFGLRSWVDSDSDDTTNDRPLTYIAEPVDLNPMNVIQNGFISHLDIETLKQLYLYVNRQTVNGSLVEKELIARGYEDYVKDCHCRYLGTSTINIQISEITSTSDTFKTNVDGSYDGRCLAEPAGRGVGADDGKYIDFDNNEPGWIFSTVSIVPETRGIQSVDPSLYEIDIESYYSPEFDGLGYEALPQCYLSIIDDFVDLNAGDNEAPDSVFGLLPRYSALKSRKSVAIGGFKRWNGALNYHAYSLDTFIARNVANSRSIYSQSSVPVVELDYTHGVGPNNGHGGNTQHLIPTAGRYWMQTLLSAWFGNLDRIFNERSYRFTKADLMPENVQHIIGETAETPWLADTGYMDSFILHGIVHFDMTTRMLPISLSWGCSSNDEGDKVDLK